VGGSFFGGRSDLGGYNAGGGQTLGDIDLKMLGGQLNVTTSFTLSMASSVVTPLVPRLLFSGGLISIDNGPFVVNAFSSADKTRISQATVLHIGGTLFAKGLTLVSAVSLCIPTAQYQFNGGVIDLQGDLRNGGGIGTYQMTAGFLTIRGNIVCDGGEMSLTFIAGKVNPVQGAIIVGVSGKLVVRGLVPFTVNRGASILGTLTLQSNILSFRNWTGSGSVQILGATLNMNRLYSIGPLTQLVLGGGLTNVISVEAKTLVISGAASIQAEGVSRTLVTSVIQRSPGATLDLFGTVFGAFPPVRYGILLPWIFDEMEFAAYSSVNGSSPFSGYRAPVGGTVISDGTGVFVLDEDFTLTSSARAFALRVSENVTVNGNYDITIGDGVAAVVGLLLKGGSSILNRAMIFRCFDDVVICVEGDAMILADLSTTLSCGITKTGPGRLIIAEDGRGVNGPIRINAGTLSLGAFGALSGNNTLIIPDNSDGVFQLYGYSLALSAFSSGNAPLSVIENGGSEDSSITCPVLLPVTYPGTLRDGLGTGKLTFVKAGLSDLTLTGQLLLTGGISVLAGRMSVDTGDSPPDVPYILDNGAGLMFKSAGFTLTHSLTVLDGGGRLDADGTLSGPLAGPGVLFIRNGNVSLTGGGVIGGLVVGYAGIGGSLNVTGQPLSILGGRWPFNVAYGTTTVRYSSYVDLSTLPSFTAEVSSINVGIGVYQMETVGTIYFARNNNITVGSSIILAAYGIDNGYFPPPSEFYFGSGISYLHCPTIKFGTSQGIGNVFIRAGGTLNIDNGPGQRADLFIGQGIYDSNRYTFGTLDGRGGRINALLNDLVIADGQGARIQFPIIFGTIWHALGTIDATTVILGRCRQRSRGRAKLYINGGTVLVGEGGLTFDSSVVGSGFSVLSVSKTGILRFTGSSPAGDFVIGPLESLAKGAHELQMFDQSLLDMNGRAIRFSDPTRKYIKLSLDGGEIRNPSLIDMDVAYRYSLLHVKDYNCIIGGLLKATNGARLVVRSGRSLSVKGFESDIDLFVLLNGTLVINGPQITMFRGRTSGSGSIVKSGSGAIQCTGSLLHSGTTDISGGTFGLSGSLSGAGVRVSTGAALVISGRVTGPIAVTNGTITLTGFQSGDTTIEGSLSSLRGSAALNGTISGVLTLRSGARVTNTSQVVANGITLNQAQIDLSTSSGLPKLFVKNPSSLRVTGTNVVNVVGSCVRRTFVIVTYVAPWSVGTEANFVIGRVPLGCSASIVHQPPTIRVVIV